VRKPYEYYAVDTITSMRH